LTVKLVSETLKMFLLDLMGLASVLPGVSAL